MWSYALLAVIVVCLILLLLYLHDFIFHPPWIDPQKQVPEDYQTVIIQIKGDTHQVEATYVLSGYWYLTEGGRLETKDIQRWRREVI